MVKKATAFITALAIAQPAMATPLLLSQKEAAEMALNKGSQAKEINLSFLQKRLGPAQTLSLFDWKLTAQSGYEKDRAASFTSLTSDYERFTTTAQLKKSFITGTSLTFDYSRISQRASLGSNQGAVPTQATLDSLGVILEQSLLANSFGLSDRAKVRAAETQFKADSLTRANELETLVLETLKKYWDTYVAQQNFKESVAARDRYKKLVDSVRRKSGYGYSSPGELNQVLAELEGREQNVKKASLTFLESMDALNVWLDLPAGTEIQFAVPEKLPQLPTFEKKEIAQLRETRAQEMKVNAAKDNLTASRSASWPTLSFVGEYYGSGRDETADGSWSSALTGTNNQYYAGLKLTYDFGSDYKNEDIIAKKAALDIERSKMDRQVREAFDKQENGIRKVQSTYAIIQSAASQKNYREKAVNELTATYNQGRTDIRTLIESMNSYFSSQVEYTRAMGNYYIALNEWAALRDDLIPEIKDENAIVIKEDFE